MYGGWASECNIKLSIGSSLAVPQGTRSRPQLSEAACHHRLTWSLWRLAQLPVEPRLSHSCPPGPPFGTLIGLLAPIALIRTPTDLRWYNIVFHNKLSCLLASYCCSIDIRN